MALNIRHVNVLLILDLAILGGLLVVASLPKLISTSVVICVIIGKPKTKSN